MPRQNVNTAIVTQWFPPEPVRIPLSIAEALRDRGHSIEILTGIPNFPNGAVAPGYRAWRPGTETVSGFRVTRSPLYPSHDSSAVRRVTNYLSWAFSSAIFGRSTLRRADVALVYSSPATAALAPAIWRRLARTPYVLIIQDLWPDSVFATGFVAGSRVARLVQVPLNAFVNWTYKSAAHVITISPGMASVLEERGVPSSKVSLVYNWADEGPAFSSATKNEARADLEISSHSFVVTYAGTHGSAQGLHAITEAAAKLSAEDDVIFLMVGDGIEAAALRDQASELGCDNIRFLGQVSQDQMRVIRAASDVQLVSLIDDPLFAVTMPSKVQSILESGTALIVMAPGDAAAVVGASGAGWAVPPGDSSGLAEAVLEAKSVTPETLRQMAQRGRDYYYQHMSREVGAKRMDAVLRNAVGQITHRENDLKGAL